MLAPIDKLKAGGNNIIQIEVTRACDIYSCSNCTRLLPFRKDDKHMSIECFRKACESVKDWPGIVAMFGGNPCVHPLFDELCEVMAGIIAPEHRGLWTNNLLGHGEVVRQTFPPGVATFNLNVHGNDKAANEMRKWLPGVPVYGSKASWHSPIMIDYRDMKYTKKQWVELRENCDINQKWSGIIMQRDDEPYAYFCEVAGALDGVRGENNGIPATADWWLDGMNSFAHQVVNCCDRGCGVPLKEKGHLDSADTYDVSKSFVELTVGGKKINTKLMKKPGKQVVETTDYQRLHT